MNDQYWIIDGNKWSKTFYSEEEAKNYASSLNNCRNCINCYNCKNCNNFNSVLDENNNGYCENPYRQRAFKVNEYHTCTAFKKKRKK